MTITVNRVRSLCARAAVPGLALLALTGLGLPAGAAATPAITIKTKALPIPGFPGTGNKLGAGAAIEGEATVTGTEYGGFPPPLTGIRFFAPAGARLHPQGFATCSQSALEQSGPSACPAKSVAGPKGSATGIVSFASERVQETASVQPFFAPGGGLEAFVDGASPVSIEIVAAAHFVNASPPYGLEFTADVPLIETVPGALDASFIRGRLEVGAAYKRGRKTISYVTLPPRCPRGGWPIRLEESFLGGATAQATSKMPCPRS
jgi:hypothetical protein